MWSAGQEEFWTEVQRLPSEKITGALVRAARALAGIGSAELARRSGLSERTIKRVEATKGPLTLNAVNLAQLHSMLEEVGVVIVAEDQDGGPGVRLRARDPAGERGGEGAQEGSEP